MSEAITGGNNQMTKDITSCCKSDNSTSCEGLSITIEHTKEPTVINLIIDVIYRKDFRFSAWHLNGVRPLIVGILVNRVGVSTQCSQEGSADQQRQQTR